MRRLCGSGSCADEIGHAVIQVLVGLLRDRVRVTRVVILTTEARAPRLLAYGEFRRG
jgi:hypothetical protein